MSNYILTLKLDTEIHQEDILDKRLEISLITLMKMKLLKKGMHS